MKRKLFILVSVSFSFMLQLNTFDTILLILEKRIYTEINKMFVEFSFYSMTREYISNNKYKSKIKRVIICSVK